MTYTRSEGHRKAWLAEHAEEVNLACLPTYSPKLNPVERFWNHLRRRVTYSHLFQTLERLVEVGQYFFREIGG